MAPIRVGFILLSNSRSALPSTRISVLNMLPYLQDAGFATDIAFQPDRETLKPDLDTIDAASLARRFDIVYIQKSCGPSVLRLVHRLESLGVRTIYGVCDVVEPDMAAATSATAVVTEYMRQLYPAELRSKIHVVHDGVEHPERARSSTTDSRGSARNPLRAVLVTSAALSALPVIGRPPPWLRVTIVGAYPAFESTTRRLRWLMWELSQQPLIERPSHLSRLIDRRLERVAWDPVTVYDRMEQADIGIIPVDTDGPAYWRVKSENRLTLKMAVGLPVIATPIPSYEPIVKHGQNAFFARTRDEWMIHFEALRDPAVRQAMGQQARKSVLPRYSKEAQAQALISVLHAALARAPVDTAG